MKLGLFINEVVKILGKSKHKKVSRDVCERK